MSTDLQSAHYQLLGCTASSNFFLGTSQKQIIDSIGLQVKSTAFSFPYGTVGKFLVNYSVSGTAAGLVRPTLTLSNCYTPNIFMLNTFFSLDDNITVILDTYTPFVMTFTIVIPENPTNAQAEVGFSAGTIPTAATSGDLILTRLNDQFG